MKLSQEQIQNFYAMVGPPDAHGCTMWRGSRHGKHGQWRVGDYHTAHIASYEIAYGAGSAEGLDVHHLCENGLCVNPWHLVAITRSLHMWIHRSGQRKERCDWGHDLTDEENIYVIPSTGERQCAICKRERRKRAKLVPEDRWSGMVRMTCPLTTGDCWETVNPRENGYQQMKYEGKERAMHVVGWLLAGEELPEGYVLHHRCKNKACVRHDHLEAMTRAEHQRLEVTGSKEERTTCPHCGRPLAGENLYRDPNGSPRCRHCRNVSNSERRRKAGIKPKRMATATHCANGHEKAEHWRVQPAGRGVCRVCESEGRARRKAKLAA